MLKFGGLVPIVKKSHEPEHQAGFHDKGKPVARRGRKATGPFGAGRVAEGADGSRATTRRSQAEMLWTAGLLFGP